MKTKADKPFLKKESLGKETEIGYPITQEDVINSDWVQEIKDKVITPCGDSISYGLVGMWDLCGNISKFTDERLEKQKNEFLEMIENMKEKYVNKIHVKEILEELKSAVEGRK